MVCKAKLGILWNIPRGTIRYYQLQSPRRCPRPDEAGGTTETVSIAQLLGELVEQPVQVFIALALLFNLVD